MQTRFGMCESAAFKMCFFFLSSLPVISAIISFNFNMEIQFSHRVFRSLTTSVYTALLLLLLFATDGLVVDVATARSRRPWSKSQMPQHCRCPFAQRHFEINFAKKKRRCSWLAGVAAVSLARLDKCLGKCFTNFPFIITCLTFQNAGGGGERGAKHLRVSRREREREIWRWS